ncbi:MAG: acyl-CoA dehydrogenase family protein [Candidatus Microthrix sp.]|uniref:Acyl-CoA dehydrogenase family protein n=1 Tax=Candidatus Neomicrothrix subdominans TaxID=2954438 RepID=A0A936TF74_9ACTN|nr:acyl-CoA dehydrogenase family protein [Candidatus Microthrix subdominans]
MDFGLSAEEQSFREEVSSWMHEHLTGEFAQLAGRGGPGDEHSFIAERMAWERELASGGWTCVGWPTEHGGRGLPLHLEVIFHEEYSRAGGPGRAGLIGEGLLGPTLIHFGSADQQQRFLPGIVDGTQYWCQGYSEPNAGSDLANVTTKARLDGDQWVLDGQKVWTSLAQWSDWCFVVARTEPDSVRHHGLSYLLVPMDGDGIETRPIRQITGTAEFNEVFFDGARTDADLVVGEPGEGWKVAMGTLAFERGALTLGQQAAFEHEFHEICADARRTGRWDDPSLRQQLASLWVRLRIMRWNSVRSLGVAESGELMPEAMIHKLYWAGLHRDMGEAAMDALGPEATLTPYGRADNTHDADEMEAAHRLFFFTRSDTIYGGSNQIQRNVIGERALGLPREPRPPAR